MMPPDRPTAPPSDPQGPGAVEALPPAMPGVGGRSLDEAFVPRRPRRPGRRAVTGARRAARRRLHSPSRRRMANLAVAALLFGLYFHASMIVLPLWATGDLGLSAAEWGKLQSLRFASALGGILILGPLSDRFGQRRVGSGSLAGAAVATATLAAAGWLAADGSPWALPLAYAGFVLVGVTLSSAFVNLNTLAQLVSDRRPGAANAIYRGCMQAGKVVAPVGATTLGVAWGGYGGVLLIGAGLLLASGLVIAGFRGEGRPPPLTHWRTEAQRMWGTYRSALRARGLMAFLHLSQLWAAFVVGAGSFLAIRLARDLALGDVNMGWLSSLAGLISLPAIALSAVLLDRLPLKATYVLISFMGAAALLAVAADAPALAVAGYLVAVPMLALSAVPFGVWVKRAAEEGGCSVASALSVFKVIQMLYASLGVALLAVVEVWLGLRAVFAVSAVIGVGLSLALLTLRDPAATRR